MQGIPSYYGADDLLINALYDEGANICGQPVMPKTPEYPSDSFEPSNKKSSTVKKGLAIGGVLTAVGSLGYGIFKLVKHIKKP